MPKITYRRSDGTDTTIEVPQGNSVMRGAVLHGVQGIVGECGGGAMGGVRQAVPMRALILSSMPECCSAQLC